MKKLIASVLTVAAPFVVAAFIAVPTQSMASGGGAHLEKADVDLGNRASLQRGAKYFVNHCLNCHSARYMRFERLGKDLGLDEVDMKENLMFTPGVRVGDTMTIAMEGNQAESWFGVEPPDLSLVARARGADWINTYLKSFYADDSRRFGVDNLVFDKVGMPNVLEQQQGIQRPVMKTRVGEDGRSREVIDHLELVEQGSMTPLQFNQMVRDLVSFLVYLGEPAQMERYSIGIWVMLFLVVFSVLAYLLKLEYWKDIH